LPDLTVVSFKWHGWRDLYSAQEVHAQRNMLQHYLKIPHRYVCVTDEPEGLDCETYPLWKEPVVEKRPTHHDSYCRLKMFSEEMAEVFPGYVLMMDLDLLIFKDITDLITWEDLRILKGGVCPYNGSMWLHKMGTRNFVWDSFDPETSPFEIPKYKTKSGKKWVGSDQGWLSVCCPGERLYDARDGIYRWSTDLRRRWLKKQYKLKDMRIIFFTGMMKPWHGKMKSRYPELYKEYMQWVQ